MKKKIAVLHAQVPFIQGGAENMVRELTKNLRLRGFDADLVSIPFKWYPMEEVLDNYLMWRMTDLTESSGEKIDLVLPLKAPTTAIRHPNKVIWLMHQHRVAYDLRDNVLLGGLNTISGGKKIIDKIAEMDTKTIAEAKEVFSISKTVTDRLRRFNHLDSQPLYHPPVLAGRYYAAEYEDYILSVGRLDRIKRVDLLIRALPYCDKKIKARIAGRGLELKNLTKLARQLGVEDRVEFLGFVPDDDLLKLYANALAVCFPPIDEDYGYITLEAFLSQKPIITCPDSGGVLEFAEHGKNGFIVDAEGEKLGACFDTLYRNKALAREMGASGYERVKDISWDNVIDELTKTIR